MNDLVEPAHLSDCMAKPCILFVDDDQRVLDLLSQIFKDTDYRTMACNSAELALGYLRKNDIDIVFSDVQMTSVTGTDLLEQVKKTNPEIIRIAMSGAFKQRNTIQLINRGYTCSYVIKPLYSPKEQTLAIYNKLYEIDGKKKEVDKLKASLAIGVILTESVLTYQ
ncbi:MAG: response regulator [Pseudomonadales bacterium]|nr:response regulator [Pseudomonadales bacterium]